MTVAQSPVQTIAVHRHGVVVDRAPADRFTLPDGTTGIRWGGLVFPLLNDDHIEVTTEATAPAQCRHWRAEPVGWRLADAPAGVDTYLFLDGDAARLRRTTQTLSAAGFAVLRAGANLSGEPGDWFIRLGAPGAGAIERLAQLLGNAPAPVESPALLRERLLIEALAEASASVGTLQRRLEAAVALGTQAADSRSVIETLQANLAAVTEQLRGVEVDALTAARAAALSRAESLASRGRKVELEPVIACLLPRLRLIGGSLTFIATELTDHSSLWRALSALDRETRGQPRDWKQVAGRPRWWEKHFSTGQDDQGRLYAKVDGTPPLWTVLVSHKQDQAGDLRRLT